MPDMDGLTLAKRLKTTYPQLPLVMPTSIGWRPHDIGKDLFAAFIAKPVKASVLRERLVDIFSKKVGTTQILSHTTHTEQLASVLPRKILLAEDHLINQKLAIATLERLGYRPDVVANGLEVIAAVKRQRYDVILMDVQMPEMNGIEATKRIREMLSADNQPHIIAITASATVQDRNECLAAGMNDHIAKPFRQHELITALEDSTAQAPLRDSVTGLARTSTTPASTQRKAIESSILAELRGMFDDATEFEQLVTDFLASSTALLDKCKHGFAEDRIADARGAAHQLVSSTKSFGAMTFSDLCRQFEHAAKAGDKTPLPGLLDEMFAEYTRVQEELRKPVNASV